MINQAPTKEFFKNTVKLSGDFQREDLIFFLKPLPLNKGRLRDSIFFSVLSNDLTLFAKRDQILTRKKQE
jgi:hypothetical protein